MVCGRCSYLETLAMVLEALIVVQEPSQLLYLTKVMQYL